MLISKKILFTVSVCGIFAGVNVIASTSVDAPKLTPEQVIDMKMKLSQISVNTKKAKEDFLIIKKKFELIKNDYTKKLKKIGNKRPNLKKILEKNIELINSSLEETDKNIQSNEKALALIYARQKFLPPLLPLEGEVIALENQTADIMESISEEKTEQQDSFQENASLIKDGPDVSAEKVNKNTGWTPKLIKKYARIKNRLDNETRVSSGQQFKSEIIEDIKARQQKHLDSIVQKAGSPFPG